MSIITIVPGPAHQINVETRGTQGLRGDAGPTGPANTLDIGTVVGGAEADATITGTAPNQTLNLTLPKGDKGDTGDAGPANSLAIGTVDEGEAGASITGASPTQVLNLTLPKGDPGDSATVAVGTTSTGAPGSSASVNNSGTASAAVLDFTIPRGDKGDAGDAATVAAGTTTTGDAGTAASVSNSGTSAAAVFDFTIPRGDKGDQGDPGPANSLSIGTVAGGASAGATITGTAPTQTLNLTLPQGDKGDTGDAATITVGTVTTVGPGDPAAITNVGTSGAAVFDFEIPQGPAGAGTGDMLASTYDPTGVMGDSFARANHTGTQAASTITGLAAIATSGDYGDLSGTPTIPTNNTQLTNGAGYITDYTVTEVDVTAHESALSITESQISDLGAYETTTQLNARDTANRSRTNHTGTQSAGTITGLATVATSGDYSDLSGTPSIPSTPGDIGAATAAQGEKADSAVQPDDLGNSASRDVGTGSGQVAAGNHSHDHFSATNNPHEVTKAQVGLGNVDNTSDANKPVSTATQTALNGKASLATDQLWAGAQRPASTALSVSSGQINWTLASGNDFTVMLTANATLNLPSDIATHVGQKGRILITQDGTGGRTFAADEDIVPLGAEDMPDIPTDPGAMVYLAYDVISATQIVFSLLGVGE